MNKPITATKNYTIHNPKKQSYRMTLPNKFFKEYNIEKSLELGLNLTLENENAVINYIHPNPDKYVTRKLLLSNHTIRIPSSIGDSLSAFNHSVNWSATKNKNKMKFKAQTTHKPDTMQESNLSKIKNYRMKPTVNKSGTQEHFDLYLTETEFKALNWSKNEQFVFNIININNKLGLQITPVENTSKKLIRNFNSSGFKQNDARIYIPKAIVRSLDMVNKKCTVNHKNNSIVIYKDLI